MMLRDKIIAAGAGGQGALRIGQIIAHAGLQEGREVSWLPSYGAEMRGGTASCSVIVSEDEIPFPMVSKPDYCIIMNEQSLDKFESQVCPGGVIILDSSLVLRKVARKDLKAYYVPAEQMAEQEGNTRGTNMVLLGAYAAIAESVGIESIYDVIDQSFTGSKAKYADSNKKLVKSGFDFIKNNQTEMNNTTMI